MVHVAPSLLGWEIALGALRARIVEVEAYRAADDAGCHAFYGRTPRTEVMFGEPGLAYVYFTYGNHWMLNVVAHEPGDASAILIRAAEPVAGLEEMRSNRPRAIRDQDLLSGPGKLCQAFGIDKRFYGIDLLDPSSELRLVPGETVSNVMAGTRIGLAPGKGDDLPWRFLDGDRLEWASKPLRNLTPIR